MRRSSRIALVALALGTAVALPACGGRTDGGNPGNLVPDTTTTVAPGTGAGG